MQLLKLFKPLRIYLIFRTFILFDKKFFKSLIFILVNYFIKLNLGKMLVCEKINLLKCNGNTFKKKFKENLSTKKYNKTSNTFLVKNNKKENGFKKNEPKTTKSNSKNDRSLLTSFTNKTYLNLQIAKNSKVSFKNKDFPSIKEKIVKRENLNFFYLNLLNWFQNKWYLKWKNILLTLSDLKLWAALQYYDYYALYALPKNYISLHSELIPNKTWINLSVLFPKIKNINKFFKIYYKFNIKKFFKNKIPSRFKFISTRVLEQIMFEGFYKPFCRGKFEKTDELERFFFLNKYLLYWKLLPNSKWTNVSYLSNTVKTENFLFKYPYLVGSSFFKNFILFFRNKIKRFLDLPFYKTKILLWNFLYAYLNTIMKKLPSNLTTKSLDSYQTNSFYFQKRFLTKLFENKMNWFESNFVNTHSFIKKNIKKLFSLNLKNSILRNSFALNWSTGKWFFWKCLQHRSYSKINYPIKTKYIRWDLVVDTFASSVRKDFYRYKMKFIYNTLNFSDKKLLWVLFPKQKLIEFNLLKSNNLYNFTTYAPLNRKFFSLLKIFWKIKKKKFLNGTFLQTPINFDFEQYQFKNDLKIFLNDILVTRTYFCSAYETPYFYYKEIYFKNKIDSWEFYFSNRLILASTTLRFPVLLTSWLFKEKYYVINVKKQDLMFVDKALKYINNFQNWTTKNKKAIYIKYLDFISSLQNIFFWFQKKIFEIFLTLPFENTNIFKFFFLQKPFKYSNNPIIYLLLYTYSKAFTSSIKENKNYNFINFIMLNFFYFSTKLKKRFSKLNFDNKLVLSQTLRISKTYPIIYFRINGHVKTKSTGVLNALIFNFNILAPGGFVNLTLNRNNPYYFSYSKQKVNIFWLQRWVAWGKFFLSNFFGNLTLNFFDNMFWYLYLSKNKNNNFYFYLIPFFFSNFKVDVLKSFPKSYLSNVGFKFWTFYIMNFENKSINVLTSKMWRTGLIKNYFFGPLNLLIFYKNFELYNFFSSSEFLYLSTFNTFSILEADSIWFPELIFSFQFDYKKLNLGRGFKLLKNHHDRSFLFFFKNNFLNWHYLNVKTLEINYLIILINNFVNNYSRFLTFQNYNFVFLRNILKKNKLFPSIFFDTKIYDIFKFRWSFFGFSPDKPIDGTLLKGNWNILNITSFISRFFIFSISSQYLTFLNGNKFFFSSKSNDILFFKLLQATKLSNISKKLLFYWTFESSKIYNFNNITYLTKFFNASNFYKPFTGGKSLLYFDQQSQVEFKNLLDFNYKALTLLFKKKSKKKLFDNKNNKLLTSFEKFNATANLIISENFKIFRNNLSYKNKNLIKFNVFFLNVKTYLILFFRKLIFLKNKILKFFTFKIKKFILLLWLFFFMHYSSKKFILNYYYFYIQFFFLIKKKIVYKSNNNSDFLFFFNSYFINKLKFNFLDLTSLLQNKITAKNLLLSLYFLGWKCNNILKTSYKNTNNNNFIFFYNLIIFYNNIFVLKNNLLKNLCIPLYLYFFSFNFLKFLLWKFYFQSKNFSLFINFKSSFLQVSSFSILNYLRKLNKFTNLKTIVGKFNLLLTNKIWLNLNINFFFWFKFFNKTNLLFLQIPFLLKWQYLNKKIINTFKVNLNLIDRNFGKVWRDFTKIQSIKLLGRIYKSNLWRNNFTLYPYLIKLFTLNKTKQVLYDHKFYDSSTPWNKKTALNITKFKLKRTRELNKEAILFFKEKNNKNYVRNFILFFSFKKRISLKTITKGFDIFMLQLFFSTKYFKWKINLKLNFFEILNWFFSKNIILYKFGKNYYHSRLIFTFSNLSLDFLSKKNLLTRNKFLFLVKRFFLDKKSVRTRKDKFFLIKNKVKIFSVFIKIISFFPILTNTSRFNFFFNFSYFHYILNYFLLLNFSSILRKLLILLNTKAKYFAGLLSSIYVTCKWFLFWKIKNKNNNYIVYKNLLIWNSEFFTNYQNYKLSIFKHSLLLFQKTFLNYDFFKKIPQVTFDSFLILSNIKEKKNLKLDILQKKNLVLNKISLYNYFNNYINNIVTISIDIKLLISLYFFNFIKY